MQKIKTHAKSLVISAVAIFSIGCIFVRDTNAVCNPAEAPSTVTLKFYTETEGIKMYHLGGAFIPEAGRYIVTGLNPGNTLNVLSKRPTRQCYPPQYVVHDEATLANGQSVELQKGEYFFTQTADPRMEQPTLTLTKS